MADDDKWMPTSAGTGAAYAPEWREKNEGAEWQRVPTKRIYGPRGYEEEGVPGPLFMGGAISQVGLMGYAQAMALAWMLAAQAEAMGRDIEVRATVYDLQYDVKARKRVTHPDDKGE